MNESAKKPEELSVQVEENVQTKEMFGKLDKQMKGIGGTLHVTAKENIVKVCDLAWSLSEQTNLPVVVVVKAQPPIIS